MCIRIKTSTASSSRMVSSVVAACSPPSPRRRGSFSWRTSRLVSPLPPRPHGEPQGKYLHYHSIFIENLKVCFMSIIDVFIATIATTTTTIVVIVILKSSPRTFWSFRRATSSTWLYSNHQHDHHRHGDHHQDHHVFVQESNFVDLKAIERTSGGGVKSSHMRMILEAIAHVRLLRLWDCEIVDLVLFISHNDYNHFWNCGYNAL